MKQTTQQQQKKKRMLQKECVVLSKSKLLTHGNDIETERSNGKCLNNPPSCFNV